MKRTKSSPSHRLAPTSFHSSQSAACTLGQTVRQPAGGQETHCTSLDDQHRPTNYRPFIILRLPEVARRLGIKRSTVYAKMAPGRYFDESFPRPVPLSAPSGDSSKPGAPRRNATAVGWVQEELDLWVMARIAERDATASRQNAPTTEAK